MRWHRHFVATFFAGAVFVASPLSAKEAPKKVVVPTDGQVLITVDGQLKTLAFGDMSIATGRQISPTELLVYGVKEGESTLLVFLQDGSRVTYRIRVLQGHPEREAARDLRSFLGEMPGITIRVAANGLITLEGRPQTTQDAARLRQAIEIFPDIRDLTARFEPGAFCRNEDLVAAIPSVPPDESNRHGLPPVIHLQRGQRQPFTATSEVKLVVLGNCEVARTFATGLHEFVMEGIRADETTMLVWFEDNAPVKFRVQVKPIDAEKTAREVRALIGDMEGVSIRVVGEKVYAEGTPITMEDANRLKKALSQYPEVRDLTQAHHGGVLKRTQVLYVGLDSQRVVTAKGKLKAVTIGNPELATSRTISDTEVLIVGVRTGEAILALQLEDGTRENYLLKIRDPNPETTLRELQGLIGDIKGITTRIVGDKVYVEGLPLTEADEVRLRKILVNYPEVRDMAHANLDLVRSPRATRAPAPPASTNETSSESAPSPKPALPESPAQR